MSEAVEPVETPAAPVSPEAEAAAKAAEIAKAAEAKAPKPPGDNRFAYLARKEQERVKKEVELKQKETALAERERKYAEQEARRKGYASNPVAALQDAFPGLSAREAYELLTNAILAEGKATPDGQVYQVRQEVEELKRLREEDARRQQEASQKAQEAQRAEAVAEFRAEILDFVKANAETFELCSIYPDESQDLIYSLIETHYEQTGETMSPKEAAEKAEAYWEGEAMKVAKARKLAGKLGKPAEEAPKTISNASTASMPSVINQPKSEADRMARAKAAMEAIERARTGAPT